MIIGFVQYQEMSPSWVLNLNNLNLPSIYMGGIAPLSYANFTDVWLISPDFCSALMVKILSGLNVSVIKASILHIHILNFYPMVAPSRTLQWPLAKLLMLSMYILLSSFLLSANLLTSIVLTSCNLDPIITWNLYATSPFSKQFL